MSNITADVAECATVKHVFAYCCLVQQNSESECSRDAIGGSGVIPVNGGKNDFARGHCECSTVVFVIRLVITLVILLEISWYSRIVLCDHACDFLVF